MVTQFSQPLETYSISYLLSSYNEIANEYDLSGRASFRDKKSAVKAVVALLSQVDSITEEVPTAAMLESSPGLNRLRASPLANVLRESVLQDQAKALEEAADRPATEPEAPVPETPAVASHRARSAPLSGTTVITVLTAKNPKREGSAAHGHFARYRTGMTVDEYGAAIRSQAQAIRNIRWDVAYGHIRLD